MTANKYRLITRADFDGVVSGGLLMELDMIDEIIFVEPKDMQDGKITVTSNDITTNLPYVEGVHLCFDHHLSETTRVGDKENLIIDPNKPSAARVVYEHFGGKEKFPSIPDELMAAVDQADSADYTEEDIFAPGPWTLLNFILDPRTGLSGFAEFLAKPISAKGLYSRIRSIIERPRPYIRAGQFFGPDRRRKDSPQYRGPERRKDKQEGDGEMSQDDVSALFD